MQAFRLGARTIDLEAGRVTGGSIAEELTPTEVRLLHYLSLRSGELIPREELLVNVWGYRPTVRSRTIDTTISRVRAKLEDDPSSPRFLHTAYGRGVRLDEVELVEALTTAFPTRFVGRSAMMEALVATVRRSRLTTVWGPGGAGKSRLLGEVLPRLGASAVSVWCGAASDGRDVDLAVAEAFGTDPKADIGQILARAPTILVLDECEAALAVVAERVRGWLQRAPRLRVLAGSRSELRVAGEQLFPVGALDIHEATLLFVDRARLREPDFDAPKDRIAHLVSLVDRLPLAVEIAASQVHIVGFDRLEALLSSPLDAVGSLGEVIERSWSLLTAEERRVLVAASVFESPFDLDDLAAVAGVPVERALRHLDAVVRHSLVAVRSGRHRLYAPVRDRARRDLLPDDPAHERHARWFGRLGTPELIERSRTDTQVRATLWGAAADLAVAFVAAAGDPELAVRCGHALLWCRARQGRTAEGLALAGRLEALPCPAADRISLANIAATLHSAAGDERAALDTLERVLPLLSTPEEHVLTRCAAATRRARLGDVAGSTRELDAALPYAPKASNYAQFLGTLAYHSPPPLDEARMREALAVARKGANLVVEVECLGMLAHTAHVRHADWDEGRRSFLRLLEICGTDETMFRPRLRAFVGLGQLERARGDLDAAEGWLEQAATLGERGGIDDLTRQARIEIARVWNQGGRHEDALGLVEPLAASERSPPHVPTARALLALAEVRERLGEHEAARRILGRVLQHGVGTDFVADALDLLAVLEGDERHLAAAASFDDRPVARARRRVIASLLARRRGEIARADAERAAAVDAIARLGLLPDSDVGVWLGRSPDTWREGT